MELITLLLMGLSYTIFTNGVSQLMVYFLTQSVSSFLLLLGFLFSSTIIVSFALLLKLGMFPFVTWYLNSLSRFPNFVFWLTGTLHKFPPLFMLLHFNLFLDMSLF